MPAKNLEEKIASAPTTCGVYIFKDMRNRVVYIGKAKNIKNRLKSYVIPSSKLDFRKQAMIRTARDVSFLVTENELEALALEANLIKQSRPRYNVLLRDDKNYPYIRIDLNKEWPYIEVVRKIKKDGALYFGPYIPASGMHEALSVIRRYFHIRLCKYNLSKPIRPCVQYQMGRCPAPCDGLISRKKYMKSIHEVIKFLQGKNKMLLNTLEKQMKSLSGKLLYEEAAKVRDRITAIERTWDSQKVVSPKLDEADVIGFSPGGEDVAFVVLFIRNGIMTGSKEFLLQRASDMDRGELLHSFIETFYSGPVLPPSRILLPIRPENAGYLKDWLREKRGDRVLFEIPQRGLKKKLVNMASENAAVSLKHGMQPDYDLLLNELKERLRLKDIPHCIGAFDVSTIQGTGSVGAFIAWEHGQFQKALYRQINIKGVQGVDDYAMMEETVKRVLNNIQEQIPDLIIIDGGKGQLTAARSAIAELEIHPEPEIIAIAKDPDRVFTKGRPPFSLEDSKPSSLFLKSIRDEVHRFAITRHRKARKTKLLHSALEEIPGVAKKRRLALLKHFGSLEGIRDASLEDIAHLRGFNKDLARKIKEFLAVNH